MKVFVEKRPLAHSREAFKNSSPIDGRIGFWASVMEVNPESCTCNVLADTGQELHGLRVASLEWVNVRDGKHLTGERNLPPVGSYVFCLMPNGDIASAFILCSGFLRSEAVHSDFKEEGEAAANTQKRVEYSGWNYEQDIRTGTKQWKNKTDEDEAVSLVIDQEEEGNETVELTVHGNTIKITKEGISIETSEELAFSIDGDVSIKGQNVTVEASNQTEIKGGSVVIGGTVTPNGLGALCGVPYCLFTGAPHSGDTSIGA